MFRVRKKDYNYNSGDISSMDINIVGLDVNCYIAHLVLMKL